MKPADFTPTRCPKCGGPLVERRCDACALALPPVSMPRCGDCLHWTPAGRCKRVDIAGPSARSDPTIEVNDYVYDYAAFYTPSDFGCTLHDPAPRPTTSEDRP